MGLKIPKKCYLWVFLLALSLAIVYTMMHISKNNGKLAVLTERTETPITTAEFRKAAQAQSPHKIDTGTPEKNEFPENEKECANLVFPPLDGYFDHWQKASTNRNHFVYSAYIDEATLRLVGATLLVQHKTEPMFCQVWHRNASVDSSTEMSIVQTPLIAKAKMEIIPENHSKRYTAAYFKCPFSKDIIPYAVSLVTGDKCQNPLNHVVIAEPSTKKYEFAVCVNTMRGPYSEAHSLVEFIEMNRILGAENFAFYDTSIAPNVQKVLDMYIKQGIVELHSWKIPLKENEIHGFGLLACLNDCLYRKRHTAEYIVFIDLDEIIIPRKPKDKIWKDILGELPSKGAYTFRNTFFPMSWPNSKVANHSENGIVKRFQLKSLLKFDRERKIYPDRERSKYIIKAVAADTVGNHFVWKMRELWTSMAVSPDIGLSHHYRYWPKADVSTKIQDLTMLKYSDDLIGNVTKAWEGITNTDGMGTTRAIRTRQ